MKSYESYTWQGKQWALAADAAAQVSAYRPDLLKNLDCLLPKTWDDVLSFAHNFPKHLSIGIPLNYTRESYKPFKIKFTNIPSFRQQPIGSILGGVGIALSAKSKKKKEAIQFMEYVAIGECQKNLFVEADGQPGYLQAWKDEKSNEITDNFFKDTLDTLTHCYVRPRYDGYGNFQMKAGEIIHHNLKQNDPGKTPTIIKELNECHAKTYTFQES